MSGPKSSAQPSTRAAPCLDEHELFELAGGRLQPGDLGPVERHLDVCSACRRVLAAVMRSDRLAGRAPCLELDAELLGSP